MKHPSWIAVARWLVRLYPRQWRERYEDEVLALIEDRGLSIGAAGDLVCGAIGEWARVAPGSLRQLLVDGVWQPAVLTQDQPGLTRPRALRLLAAMMATIALFTIVIFLLTTPVAAIARDWSVVQHLPPILFAFPFYYVGLLRLITHESRSTAEDERAFQAELARYPLPRINQLLSRITQRFMPALGQTARLTQMHAGEGAVWIATSLALVSLERAAGKGAIATGLWGSLLLCWLAATLICSVLAAMIRRAAHQSARTRNPC